MILHAASFVAFFVTQAQQAQCVVQCIPSVPGAWWDRLLQFLPQLIVSVIPVAGGVWIAIWSLRAMSKRDHERWILDQKKAEWKELLKKAAEIERTLPVVSMTRKDRALNIANRLKKTVSELSETRASCVFLLDFFREPDNLVKFLRFIKDSDDADSYISAYREQIISDLDDLTQKERSREIISKITNKTEEISNKYFDFIEWLRREAANDLDIAAAKRSSLRK
jgi:hypothetical protein